MLFEPRAALRLDFIFALDFLAEAALATRCKPLRGPRPRAQAKLSEINALWNKNYEVRQKRRASFKSQKAQHVKK